MPNNIVKSFAEKSGKSESEVESKWNEAKKIAKKDHSESDKEFYPIVTGILKKMLNISEGEIMLKEDEPVSAPEVADAKSTQTGDMATTVTPLGGPITKREMVKPDGEYGGYPYFDVDSNDFNTAAVARRMRSKYNIQNPKVKEYMSQNGYAKRFLLKNGDRYTKVDRGY